MCPERTPRVVAALLALLALSASDALAQRTDPAQTAAVVIDGVVRDVYRSDRGPRGDALLQIEVNASALGRGPRDGVRAAIPAPGDVVYVHIPSTALPSPDARLRVYLSPRDGGGWRGTLAEAADQPAAPPGQRPIEHQPAPLPRPPQDDAPALRTLGIKAESVQVKNHIALRITELVEGGPAQTAGIEPGDVIVGANGQPFASLDQLATQIRRGGRSVAVAVLNVRNGETVEVKVDLDAAPANVPDRPEPPPTERRPAPIPSPTPTPAAEPTLGIRGEAVRVGILSTAFRVTEVQPNSAAQAAGIEVGDIIVKADGTRIMDQKSLDAAAKNNRGSLTLTVKDSRSGREVPIEVNLKNTAARGSTPADTRGSTPSTPAPSGTNRALGVATEATTVDLTLAVKVTRVEPGSPAERAGVRAGDIITAVDDSAVFAPDLLDALVGQSKSGQVTLSILSGRTGQTSRVKVDVSRR